MVLIYINNQRCQSSFNLSKLTSFLDKFIKLYVDNFLHTFNLPIIKMKKRTFDSQYIYKRDFESLSNI